MKKAEFEINSIYLVRDETSEKTYALRVAGHGTKQGANVVFFRNCQNRGEYTGRLSERGQFAKLYFSDAPDEVAAIINAANVTLTADGRG
jgi:hypothetical protein